MQKLVATEKEPITPFISKVRKANVAVNERYNVPTHKSSLFLLLSVRVSDFEASGKLSSKLPALAQNTLE